MTCGKGPVDGGCLMILLSAVLYFAAFVAPAWAVSSTSYLGLWQECPFDGNHTSLPSPKSCHYVDSDHEREGWLFVAEITGSLAMGFVILSSVLFIITVKRSSIGNIFYVAASSLCALLAGGCMMATLAIFAMNFNDTQSLTFGFYATVMTAILCFVSTLLGCVYMKCPSQYDDELPLVRNPCEVQ